MSEIQLLEAEQILSRDTCLKHLGPLAVHVNIIITNVRLFIVPAKRLEKMIMSSSLIFLLDDIEKLQIKGINSMLHLTIKGEEHRFSGKHTNRILTRLQQHKEGPSEEGSTYALTSQNLFQAETMVYLKAGFASKGYVILRADSIEVHTYQTLETRLFKNRGFTAKFSEISNMSYHKLNRSLTLEKSVPIGQVEGLKSIMFFGEQAYTVYRILQLVQNGQTLSSSVTAASIYKGQLAVGGYLFILDTNLQFLPTGILDVSVGQKRLKLPADEVYEIQKLSWAANRIQIKTLNDSWQLDIKEADLWQVEFTKSIQLAAQKSKKEKNFFIISQRIIYQSFCCLFKPGKVYLGDIVLTNEDFHFFLQGNHKPLVEFPISAVKSTKAKENRLLIKTTDAAYLFNTPSLEKIIGFNNKLQNCAPPEDIPEARGNQIPAKLFGKSMNIFIYEDQSICGNMTDVELIQVPVGIRINPGKDYEPVTLEPGAYIRLDITKLEGRYQFRTKLIENFTTEPDPVGNFYLTCELPDNLFYYNRRDHFRMSYRQKSYVERMWLGESDRITIGKLYSDYTAADNTEIDKKEIQTSAKRLIALREQKKRFTFPLKIVDISVSGCRIALPYWIPSSFINKGLQLEFPLPLGDKKYFFSGTLMYCERDSRFPDSIFAGIRFHPLTNKQKKNLFSRILEIERRAIRGIVSDEEMEQYMMEKEFLNNPALRSAHLLLKNPAFQRLNTDEAVTFLSGGNVRSFQKGQILMGKGAMGSHMIIVTAGKVNVMLDNVHLATLGEGNTLGEMALIDPAPRSATVVAIEAGSLIEIKRDYFEMLLNRSDVGAIKALQGITTIVFNRLQDVNKKVRTEVVKPKDNVFSRLFRTISNSASRVLQ